MRKGWVAYSGCRGWGVGGVGAAGQGRYAVVGLVPPEGIQGVQAEVQNQRFGTALPKALKHLSLSAYDSKNCFSLHKMSKYLRPPA